MNARTADQIRPLETHASWTAADIADPDEWTHYLTDAEIAELMKVPRSTVQYRRTSSFELLKRYLEERADEWND